MPDQHPTDVVRQAIYESDALLTFVPSPLGHQPNPNRYEWICREVEYATLLGRPVRLAVEDGGAAEVDFIKLWVNSSIEWLANDERLKFDRAQRVKQIFDRGWVTFSDKGPGKVDENLLRDLKRQSLEWIGLKLQRALELWLYCLKPDVRRFAIAITLHSWDLPRTSGELFSELSRSKIVSTQQEFTKFKRAYNEVRFEAGVQFPRLVQWSQQTKKFHNNWLKVAAPYGAIRLTAEQQEALKSRTYSHLKTLLADPRFFRRG